MAAEMCFSRRLFSCFYGKALICNVLRRFAMTFASYCFSRT